VAITCVASGMTTGSVTPTGGTFNKGLSTVTCHATDSSRLNSADCSFSVTVTDNQIPTVSCPATPITHNTDPGVCTAAVSYSVTTRRSSDLVAITCVASGMTTGPVSPSGGTFNKGL